MILERSFCRYCREVVVSGEYHSSCLEQVESYRGEADKNRESPYSVKMRIEYYLEHEYRTGSRRWLEYTNTVVITGSQIQRTFIDLIYRDLKEQFQLERIDLPFPLMSDANGLEFVVVNDWNIWFKGWAVCYPGSLLRRGELYGDD